MQTAPPITLTNTQALVGLLIGLATLIGGAFTLGRISGSFSALTKEMREGFAELKLTLVEINRFREDSLRNREGWNAWRETTNDRLEGHDQQLGKLHEHHSTLRDYQQALLTRQDIIAIKTNIDLPPLKEER